MPVMPTQLSRRYLLANKALHGWLVCLFCWCGRVTVVSATEPVVEPSCDRTRPLQVEDLAPAPGTEMVMQASRWLSDQQPQQAMDVLAAQDSPAGWLLRARANRLLGRTEAAHEALEKAHTMPALRPLVVLETGLQAAAQGDAVTAVNSLLPIVQSDGVLSPQAAVPLWQTLLRTDPAALLRHYDKLFAHLPADDLDARSLLMEARAQAQEKIGDSPGALATRLQRYLDEPVSTRTPKEPPEGLTPTPLQALQRIERLVEAHRNDRALLALERLEDQALPVELLCRKHFAHGLAARKMRRYPAAEEHLNFVVAHCQMEPDLLRRAAYLRAKVISIRDGLRAVSAIDDFAKAYPEHSMTDDVLFWAGDLYQRRGREAEALGYYRRIDALNRRDDQCAEARWRIGWMAYRRDSLVEAHDALARVLLNDGCAPQRSDKARANYWLGRIAEQQNDPGQAQQNYQEVLSGQPLGFYAQQALPRLLSLQSLEDAAQTSRQALAPVAAAPIPLCPDSLALQEGFTRALSYLRLGLGVDAAIELKALSVMPPGAQRDNVPTALGVQEAPPVLRSIQGLDTCGPAQAALLLVLLLDRAGEQHEAHWRLRTEFGDEFGRTPTARDLVLWKASYPLAFREFIGPSEVESHLPLFALQALSREESAFDPKVVSWAEAYGLTQLLLSSGQQAGRTLNPKITLKAAEELLEPQINARLGASLLAAMMRRLGGNYALALAAYNAGEDVAVSWWKRFAGQEFAVFAEEISIQETRGYVKRVLRTYGIYRWLYSGAVPALAVSPVVPARPAS